MKVLKKIGKVVLIILAVIVSISIIWTTTHHIISGIKNSKYADMGQTVKVNNTEMRVYVTGKGNETIVMLSGLGTVSPISDFMPLAKMLGENYKVAIVECPGYGFSEDTNAARTNENIISEVRSALNQANVKPPYILMPHSISGIYSLYYAKTYPNEVKGIIGIDQSMPNQTKAMPNEENPALSKNAVMISKIKNFVGYSRIIAQTSDFDEFANMLTATGNYSNEQIQVIKEIYCQRSISNAISNENSSMLANTKELYDVKYPENLPVLSFLSNVTIEMTKELVKNKVADKDWGELHEEAIKNPAIQKIVLLDGPHYLHRANAKEMAKTIKEFLDSKEVKEVAMIK